jgi:hypothetical protein
VKRHQRLIPQRGPPIRTRRRRRNSDAQIAQGPLLKEHGQGEAWVRRDQKICSACLSALRGVLTDEQQGWLRLVSNPGGMKHAGGSLLEKAG